MHTSTHAFIGTVIGEVVLYITEPLVGYSIGLVIAFLVAFWSHTEVDRLGEGNCYGTFYKAILVDSIGLGGAITFSAYILFGWTGVLFALAANIIDIIDKFRNHVMKLPSIFPSHKRGFKMWCHLTAEDTKYINVILTLLSILTSVYWSLINE